LTELIEQPDSSVNEISGAIGKDPGLAARVLKLANSVFYGFVSQIRTLEQAVQIIGLNETRDLVLASSIIEGFDQVPSELLNVTSFWHHSIACATAAALIAKERNQPEPERFFVGGLLHDLGRLMMVLEAPDAYRQVLERCEREGELAATIERQVLGFDHATLGAELVSAWQLPKSLSNMVRWHHNPVKAPNPQLDSFIIHYADFITTMLDYGNGGELLVAPLVVPPSAKTHVLDDAQLELLAAELDRQCQEIFPILVEKGRGTATAQWASADPARRGS
jgi:putative nucleotidyltransferase with HDIG domain